MNIMKPLFSIVSANEYKDTLASYHERGLPPGESTGWMNIDRFYTVMPGLWTLVTGIPSHGKSTWLDALMINLSRAGWRFVVYSPENQPYEFHLISLVEKFVGKKFGSRYNGSMTIEELNRGLTFIDEHFKIMQCSGNAMPTLEDIVEGMGGYINDWIDNDREGNFGVVIDPWNEVNHSRADNMSETTHIGQSLAWFRQWCREWRVHGWIVAHPKMLFKDKNGVYPVPSPYDISGSAHWYNKADCCITVWRDEGRVEIHVKKIRFRNVGKQGIATLEFDPACGRYTEIQKITCRDTVDW